MHFPRFLKVLMLIFGIYPSEHKLCSLKGFLRLVHRLVILSGFVFVGSWRVISYFIHTRDTIELTLFAMIKIASRVMHVISCLMVYAVSCLKGATILNLLDTFEDLVEEEEEKICKNLPFVRRYRIFSCLLLGNCLLTMTGYVLVFMQSGGISLLAAVAQQLPNSTLLFLWPLAIYFMVKVCRGLLREQASLLLLRPLLANNIESCRYKQGRTVDLLNEVFNTFELVLLIPVFNAFLHVLIEGYILIFEEYKSAWVSTGSATIILANGVYMMIVIATGETMAECNESIVKAMVTIKGDSLDQSTKSGLNYLASQLVLHQPRPEVCGISLRSNLLLGLTGTIVTYLVLVAQFNRNANVTDL